MAKSSLTTYKKRRRFDRTPEPAKTTRKKSGPLPIFVVQKHHARRLHYDFRLEMGKVLKSWAVPKGPPRTPAEKHLAVFTEDHPLDYADFEGVIPEGEYGAGKVEIWDKGTYINLKEIPLLQCLEKGTLEIELHGKKLKGKYALVRFRENNWLLIKMKKK